MRWDRALADAAFDAEHNHRLAQDGLGIRATVTPVFRRGGGAGPVGGKYRNQMARHFRPRSGGARHKRVYGQRWQAESAFSRHKRRLGSALFGRSDASRARECYLRVLTQHHAPRRT